jgi:hypothetical protein
MTTKKLNHLGNWLAVLMWMRDHTPIIRGNKLFAPVAENAERAEAIIKMHAAYLESASNATLDKFEKGSKKMSSTEESNIALSELFNLSRIIDHTLSALAEIEPKHYEAIGIDFSAVLVHYREQPNKLILSQKISSAHRERLKSHPTCSAHSYELGWLDCINDAGNEK